MAEHVLVSGRGWSFSESGVTNLGRFTLLGPFTVGDIIDRLEVYWWVNGSTTMLFGASLGSSNEASGDSFRAGQPIIQRSNVSVNSVPVVQFDALEISDGRIVIPVGLEVGVATLFMVCRVTHTSALRTSHWFVTAFVSRSSVRGKAPAVA